MNYQALISAMSAQIAKYKEQLEACQELLLLPTNHCGTCWDDGVHSCEFCHPDSFVSTATCTCPTPSSKAHIPDSAPAADTKSQRTGTSGVPDEYIEILTDVADLLNGIDNDATPLVRMAAMAIEYELSERLLDALGNA